METDGAAAGGQEVGDLLKERDPLRLLVHTAAVVSVESRHNDEFRREMRGWLGRQDTTIEAVKREVMDLRVAVTAQQARGQVWREIAGVAKAVAVKAWPWALLALGVGGGAAGVAVATAGGK